MSFFNLLLSLLRGHMNPAYVTGFTLYDEEGYPIEESSWDDEENEDEDILEEDDLDIEEDETEWE